MSFYDWGKTIRGISVKCYIETATDNYRWLKKKSGDRILQRMWKILHETLLPEEIECRVAQVTAKGCSLLLYKTARVDRAILDETYGNYWQNDFKVIDGKAYQKVPVTKGREYTFSSYIKANAGKNRTYRKLYSSSVK